RSHRHVRNSTRNDVCERRKIAANVERESMHRDPVTNPDTDRRDLTMADPNTGETFALLRLDFVAGKKINQRLLEPAQVAMQVLPAPAKIDNRIAHQLPGPMIRRLTAPIDCKQRMG